MFHLENAPKLVLHERAGEQYCIFNLGNVALLGDCLKFSSDSQ